MLWSLLWSESGFHLLTQLDSTSFYFLGTFRVIFLRRTTSKPHWRGVSQECTVAMFYHLLPRSGQGGEWWTVHLSPQISEVPEQEHAGTEEHGMSLKQKDPARTSQTVHLDLHYSTFRKPHTSHLGHAAHMVTCPNRTMWLALSSRSFKSSKVSLKQTSERSCVPFLILNNLPSRCPSKNGILMSSIWVLSWLLSQASCEVLPIKYGQCRPLKCFPWGREEERLV